MEHLGGAKPFAEHWFKAYCSCGWEGGHGTNEAHAIGDFKRHKKMKEKKEG